MEGSPSRHHQDRDHRGDQDPLHRRSLHKKTRHLDRAIAHGLGREGTPCGFAVVDSDECEPPDQVQAVQSVQSALAAE